MTPDETLISLREQVAEERRRLSEVDRLLNEERAVVREARATLAKTMNARVIGITMPIYVKSESGEYESRITGVVLDEDFNITECLTEYGSVPAAVGEAAIRRALRRGR